MGCPRVATSAFRGRGVGRWCRLMWTEIFYLTSRIVLALLHFLISTSSLTNTRQDLPQQTRPCQKPSHASSFSKFHGELFEESGEMVGSVSGVRCAKFSTAPFINRYSSGEALLRKLRYAIHNCKAIDIDAYARTNLPEEAAS